MKVSFEQSKCFKKKEETEMRKVLIVALLTTFLMASAVAFAEGPWQELKTYVSINSDAKSKTVLSTTTALTIAYERVLGFVVVPYNVAANSELTLGLYDATTAATLSESYVFDEAEWDDDGNNQPRWYPHPKRLARGLAFIQGANTVAIIYYEDMRGQ